MIKKNTIRLAGVIRESIVDGPGIRFVIFAQGCPHHCPECHNPNTHDFKGGYISKIDNLTEAIDENPLLKGVTFSGGEPLLQAEEFLTLANELEKRNLDIVIYSGYTYEEILEMSQSNSHINELMAKADILIDGPYIREERNLTLKFRGSNNQRVIDLKASQKANKAIVMSIE